MPLDRLSEIFNACIPLPIDIKINQKGAFRHNFFIYNLEKFCKYRIHSLVRFVDHLHVDHRNAIYFSPRCVKGLMA